MPGKTLLINHFLITTNSKKQITKEWFLVDLPGYGYAQRGKKEMQKLQNLITHYVLDRAQLTCLFVLVDIRLKPQKNDLEFINFLGENQIPFAIVFTKADKVKSISEQNKNIQTLLDTLREDWEELPPYFITSSASKKGKEEIIEFISKCGEEIEENQQNP